MKSLAYLHPLLQVKKTPDRGRGVFAIDSIEADTVIEISPVIVMSGKDRKLLDQTLLHDYIFEWGAARRQCCMALGYIPLYNHSYNANCHYQMNFRKQLIAVITLRPIEKGEELQFNYNGEEDKDAALWFEVK